jgi:serine/threonine protein kinase
MQHAVGRLLATKCFPGRVIKRRDGYMIMEECIPNRAQLLPAFVASHERYTERECRNIFRQMVLRVQAFHEAGLAHRNLHPSNFIVETGVSNSTQFVYMGLDLLGF